MKVAVHDIRKSNGLYKNFEFEGPYELPGIVFEGPLHVRLKLTNAGSLIVVEGPLQAPVELVCARCGESFPYDLETDVEEHFLPAGSAEATATPVDPLDGIFTFENERLELDQLLRQEIVAALPMKAYCREDCKGLCAGCGINLNRETCLCSPAEGDPRWAGLLANKGKVKKEKRSR